MKSITADRARKKICPMYKAAILSNPSADYNLKDLNEAPAVMCDAHLCIHWRWDTDDAGRCYLYGGDNA